MTLFKRFLKDESGATAIEYALIAAIIGIGLIAALGPLNDEISAAYSTGSTPAALTPARCRRLTDRLDLMTESRPSGRLSHFLTTV